MGGTRDKGVRRRGTLRGPLERNPERLKRPDLIDRSSSLGVKYTEFSPSAPGWEIADSPGNARHVRRGATPRRGVAVTDARAHERPRGGSSRSTPGRPLPRRRAADTLARARAARIRRRVTFLERTGHPNVGWPRSRALGSRARAPRGSRVARRHEVQSQGVAIRRASRDASGPRPRPRDGRPPPGSAMVGERQLLRVPRLRRPHRTLAPNVPRLRSSLLRRRDHPRRRSARLALVRSPRARAREPRRARAGLVGSAPSQILPRRERRRAAHRPQFQPTTLEQATIHDETQHSRHGGEFHAKTQAQDTRPPRGHPRGHLHDPRHPVDPLRRRRATGGV